MITPHAHSNYSLLKGTIPIEELISFAVKEGSKSVVLTDDNGMYGILQFAKLAQQQNIKPILGSLIDDPNNPNESALFLAKNNNGYSQLCRLITTRKLKEDFKLHQFEKSQPLKGAKQHSFIDSTYFSTTLLTLSELLIILLKS